MGKATSPRAKGATVKAQGKAKTKALTANQVKLCAQAEDIGASAADAFVDGAKVFRAIGASEHCQREAGDSYKVGYMTRYFAKRPTNSNMTIAQYREKAIDVLERPGKRDALGKKAFSAAGASLNACRSAAGIDAKGAPKAAKAKRVPKTPTVPANDDAPGLSDATKTMLDASPGFKSTAELNAYGLKQAVALIGTCNKNAIAASNAFKSACETFAAAMRALAPSE